jgi:antitoxin ParD1/3/4
MNVSIGDRWEKYVEQTVKAGRYGSASELVREGLRLVEERETKLDALRAALIDGENSGPSTTFDFDGFLARKRSLPQAAE